jgi:demethoxyubiquinone hydroxylase (CLK1/Coq7/Cat5 family)
MNDEELIKVLSDLVQLEINATYSYKHAIKKIEDKIIREHLKKFLKEHHGHIELLDEEIRNLGNRSPHLSRDLKGFVMGSVTVLRSVSGFKGALKALKAIEDLTNRRYGRAVVWDISPSTNKIIKQCITDEKSHLDYIVMNLEALSL